MSAFHWKDNVYFERKPNGDVRVWKALGPNGPALFEITVPSREWCSIVTACSAHPVSATYAAVEKIHRS